MGKTPKKAAPGGDERNLYNRRPLKATAASKASETNLHKRQRESESSNRSTLNIGQKKIPARKNFKSKLGAPSKFNLDHTKKLLTKIPIKEKKLTDKTVESKPTDMQPDSEEAEFKVSESTENDSEREVSKEKVESVECVDHTSPEPASKEQDSTNKETTNKGTVKETVIEEQTKEITTDSAEAKPEEPEENDLHLSLAVEDSPIKSQEKQSEEISKESKETVLQLKSKETVESKNESEKEDLHSESQTDTESYSVDVLESTTSELSEVSEAPSQNEGQEKKLQETIKTDTVSYDPAITLKDVQIKLNDCMKESSKCEANDSPIPPRDLSFGKTLKNISGRRSLSRMRHVTLREQRYSPNNSMFVNTSGASLLPDDTEDFKILRYSTGLSDTLSANGMSERKRKHEEEWSSAKKPKPESENSLLNTSISILKGLRRPIQISTPVSELKFQTGKLDLDESNKPVDEGGKKWCVIM